MTRKITKDYLATLPHDQLAELMALADQKIADERKYDPNPVQDAVHRSQAFIRALFSGNGVGKTTACIQEAIWTSTGTHPHRETARLPNIVIIVLDDSSKADTVYLAGLRKRNWYDVSKLKLYKDGRSHTQRVVFPNGSEWHFMTHDMAEDKWESIECACVIFDEPPPRFIYIALLRGMREKDMRPWIMFAGTPLGRNAPWMYREIFRPWKFGQDDEIACFFGNTYANLSNLDPETINRWKKRYSEKELKTRLEGSFEFLSGRIFNDFSREHHVEPDFPFPSNWKCILAIDPHLRKNHTAVIMGIDPDGELWVVREIETSLAGRRAAEFLVNSCEGYNVRVGICDNFGSIKMYGDGEERKSFIEIFNEVALRMNRARLMIKPTTRAQKRDDEWIEDMRDWLRLETDLDGQLRSKFHVFASCVKTIDNFESYVWDEHTGRKADLQEPKEEPLGTAQDFLMCVKYALSTKPEKIGADKILSKRMVQGKALEYESHEKKKVNWYKD
jgi:hypothetical protein